jgi:PAB-dependent poly(A)-specific ribonuclease subunit 3
MSCGGHGHSREHTDAYNFSPMRKSLSNALAGTPCWNKEPQLLPTIQPTSPNKGAPSHTPTANRPAFFPLPTVYTHANAAASSGSSTTESLSGLTSHSSRDSLPVVHAHGVDSSPQKQVRNSRRNKSSKSNTRWSRGGTSLDDTGSDRKPPTSQPAETTAPNAAQSPQRTYKQYPSHTPTRNPAGNQGRLMATTFGSPSGDSRRGVSSPRPKGRGMRLLSYCLETAVD